MIDTQPYTLFHLVDESGSAAGLRVFFRRGETVNSAEVAAKSFAASLGALTSLAVVKFDIVFRSVAEKDTIGQLGSDTNRRILLFVGEDEINGDIVEIPVMESGLLQNDCIEMPDVNNPAFVAIVADIETGFYKMNDGATPLIVESIATGRNYGATVSEWVAGI